MALTRRLLIDLSSRRRLFNAGKFSTTQKKKPVFHEAVNLAGFLRCSRALVSWMVAERKMQPSPPPAEHRRRAVRYVVFLALSLLAFSCWALVSSRIDSAVLAATAAGGSGAAPLLTAEHDDDGIIATSNHAEMPASSGNATSRAAVEVGSPAMTTRQPPSGERTTTTTCDAESALLRVYLYDLPPEFHFGMLGWDGKAAGTAWPDVGDPRAVPRYPGGLNLQHSVEYWSPWTSSPPPPRLHHLLLRRSPSSLHRREGDEREPRRRVLRPVLRVAELQPSVEAARPWERTEQAPAGRAGEVSGEAGGMAAVGRREPPRRAAPPEQNDGRPAAAQRRHVRPLRLRQVPAGRRQPEEGRDRAVQARRALPRRRRLAGVRAATRPRLLPGRDS